MSISKIKQLEKMRFSILTNDLTKCHLCGNKKDDIHEVYEGARRIPSMKWGCCIPVCRNCHRSLHNNYSFALHYKQICQQKFEELYSREKFIEIFKRSYL